MDSATGGSGTSDRAYYLVEYILVYLVLGVNW